MHATLLLARLRAAVLLCRWPAIYSLALYCALAITTTTARAVDEVGVPVETSNGRFIALLLPSQSKAFKTACDTIRAGVLAAERVHGDASIPLVRAYATDDKEENISAVYEKAVADGAQVVIGPLTKPAINYLSDSTKLRIPVLALNSFDDTTLPQSLLYSFSLSVETEAAQVAQVLQQNMFTHPVILQVNDTLSQRMAQGFAQEWRKVTGSEPLMITVSDARRDAAELKQQLLDANADAIFLAMDGKAARLVRPYLGNDRAIYGTSQMDSGRLGRTALVDLTGVRYLDMPWMGMPNSEGYDLYNRTRSSSNDLERLFAFGIDAWQLAAMLADPMGGERIIDGVTGQLIVGKDHVVQRVLISRSIGGK